MFKRVIVKKPGKSYVNGLTTSDLGKPDYELVKVQHDEYIEALKKCNVDVRILPLNEDFPDSTFVEDTAVLTPEFAIITNPGIDSRADEIIEMEPVIKEYYDKVFYIKAPGTLDGGDVLQIEKQFYIGLSSRTNEEGAKQFIEIVEQNGYKGKIVELKELFHLKTGISYIGNNTIVVTGELVEHPDFQEYDKIIVPKEEEYAANCIRVNDYVIIPKGYPQTKKAIEDAGFQTIEVNTSEFRKHDGGLSCLSLRF